MDHDGFAVSFDVADFIAVDEQRLLLRLSLLFITSGIVRRRIMANYTNEEEWSGSTCYVQDLSATLTENFSHTSSRHFFYCLQSYQ